MAQGDLYRLLEEVTKALAKDMESGGGGGSERYRKELELQPHDLHLDAREIEEEILIQLEDFYRASKLKERSPSGQLTQYSRSKLGSKTGADREEARRRVGSLADSAREAYRMDEIIEDERRREKNLKPQKEEDKVLKIIEQHSLVAIGTAKRLVNFRNGKKIGGGPRIEQVGGDGRTSIILRITPERANSNVFDFIKRELLIPFKTGLDTKLQKTNIFLDQNRTERILNLGHVNSVSLTKVAKAINAIDSGISKINVNYSKKDVGVAAADMLRIEIASKFTHIGSELGKDFKANISVVKFESEATNLTDSDYEAAILKDAADSLDKIFNKLNKDWANQNSSNSLIDQIKVEIFAGLEKNKNVKVTGKPKKNEKPNKTNKEFKIRKPKRKPPTKSGFSVGKIKLPTPVVAQQASPVSMQNLIPMLNQKLPDLVKSNMGKNGALHNRTGRFAESVEVLSISGDGLNVGFTYQTDPYAVFESQGNRDPRRLIDVSIRQAAAGIMNVRFSTGRVR